jgi:hypothetical protein
LFLKTGLSQTPNSVMAKGENTEYIVVGIDGTSSREWMKADGSNSHTYQFIKDFHGGTTKGIDKQWFHGTSDVVFDSESTEIAQRALDFIIGSLKRKFPKLSINNTQPLQMFDVNTCKQSEYYNEIRNEYGGDYYNNSYSYTNSNIKIPVKIDSKMLRSQPLSTDDVKIVLIGHSRGGLATTILAKMLSPVVKVYFMGLYDSVDRNSCFNGATIENVKYVYHAMRHPDMHSRGTFSNTSTAYSEGVEYAAKYFYTSHGGMGGDYVSDPKEATITGDKSCIPQPKERVIYSPRGGVSRVIDNTHPLTKRFGKPINEICEDGRMGADGFIRGGAIERGLPLSR